MKISKAYKLTLDCITLHIKNMLYFRKYIAESFAVM